MEADHETQKGFWLALRKKEEGGASSRREDEQRHDEVASIFWRKLVGLDDVSERRDEVEMGERDGYGSGREKKRSAQKEGEGGDRHRAHLWAEIEKAARARETESVQLSFEERK